MWVGWTNQCADTAVPYTAFTYPRTSPDAPECESTEARACAQTSGQGILADDQ